MKRLKEKIKKPFYLFLAAFFALILIMTVVFLYEFKEASVRAENCSNKISSMHDSLNKVNETISRKYTEHNSAELLLSNANKILSTVYFGTADEVVSKKSKNFTAFSLFYKEKFYLITAGHCVEFDGKSYENFKFKANNSKTWIRPDLLAYNNDYENKLDYAIFYLGNPVNKGLIPANPDEDMSPQYVLGNLELNLNLVKRFDEAKEGESGSPVLNSRCHVVGITIRSDGTYTPITVVIDALAKLTGK